MAQAPASTRVFELPELLELIILQFPVRGIFQAQRISTAWRKLISDSPTIQQKLFLKPVAPSVTPLPVVNEEWLSDDLAYRQCLRINKVFFDRSGIYYIRHERLPILSASAKIEVKDTIDVGGKKPLRVGVDRCNSSHSMFITQPPCTVAEVETMAGLNLTYHTLRNRAGLRCRDLIEAMESMPLKAENTELLTKSWISVVLEMRVSDVEVTKWEEEQEEAMY